MVRRRATKKQIQAYDAANTPEGKSRRASRTLIRLTNRFNKTHPYDPVTRSDLEHIFSMVDLSSSNIPVVSSSSSER